MIRTTILMAALVGCAEAAPQDYTSDAPIISELTDLERPTTIPDHAIEIAPDIFWLGEALDLDGTPIEGFAFVDRHGEEAKGGEKGKPGGGGGKPDACWTDIGGGSQEAVEPWGVGTMGVSGLSASAVQGELAGAMDDWEGAAAAAIFGSYDSGSSGIVDLTQVDGENNVIFGDAGGGSTVAVTYSWGIFSGPPKNRRLVEWDQIYGDSWDWSIGDPVASGAFDFRSVGAHELGHAAGLGHPSSTCTEETMYAYVSFEETKKRSLNAGDIAGIRALY